MKGAYLYKLKNYYLLTFINTSQLLKVEKELKNKNVECLIVPTPRILSKSCSESIKIKEGDINKIQYDCRIDHFINNQLEVELSNTMN